MACYRPAAPQDDVPHVQIAPRPPPKELLVYQDLTIDPAPAPPVGVFGVTPAVLGNITLNAGGANICDNASNYYVGVVRMALTIDLPLCIPPQLLNADGTPFDNVTTAWSITLVVSDPNAVLPDTGFYSSQVYMKVPVSPSVRFPFACWTLDDFVWMVNNAWLRAWNALPVAARGLVPEQPVIVIRPGSAATAVYSYPAAYYMTPLPYLGPPPPPAPVPGVRCYVCFSGSTRVAFAGYPFVPCASTVSTAPGGNLVSTAPGADFCLSFRSYGDNLDLPTALATFNTLAPTVPLTTRISLFQNAPTYLLPSVAKLLIKSSLPVVQEFIGSSSQRQVVLTDMVLDSSQFILGENATKLVYDTQGVPGGVRWMKMTGGAPISAYSIEIVTVDWQGVSRPYILFPGNQLTMKLAFCPAYVLDGH
jgi:hypothetical protein